MMNSFEKNDCNYSSNSCKFQTIRFVPISNLEKLESYRSIKRKSLGISILNCHRSYQLKFMNCLQNNCNKHLNILHQSHFVFTITKKAQATLIGLAIGH